MGLLDFKSSGTRRSRVWWVRFPHAPAKHSGTCHALAAGAFGFARARQPVSLARRRRLALATTVTELVAMAASAMRGCRSPRMARGMATRL